MAPSTAVNHAIDVRNAAEAKYDKRWREENADTFQRIVDHAVLIRCAHLISLSITKAGKNNV